MNLKLVNAVFVAAVVFSILSNETEQLEVINATKMGSKPAGRIIKAFLMQCPHNFSSHNSVQVQVTVQIVMHTHRSTSKVRQNHLL